MSDRLGFWSSWRSRRHWEALQRAIPPQAEAAALRERCASLVEASVKHGRFRTSLLKNTLPLLVRSYPPLVAAAILDLALRLISKDRNATPASGAEHADNGLAMLEILVPALAEAHLSDKELFVRIDMLNRFAGLSNKSGASNVWSALGAVVALPRDRFGAVLDAVVDLSRSGIDPSPLARWTAAGCCRIGNDAFRRVFESAVHIAEMRLDPQPLLDPLLVLGHPQLPAPDLQALLETIEQILGGQRRPDAAAILAALGRALPALPGSRLRSILDLTQRMLAAGTNPVEVLDGLPALAALDEPRFAAAVDFAGRMKARGLSPAPALRQGVLTATNVTDWQGYLDSLDVALRLVENKIDPLPLLQLGIPLVATISDFRAALRVMEQHLVRSASWSSAWFSWRSHGLQVAHGSRTPDELENALRVFELLVDHIGQCGGSPSTSPGLAELSRQALSLVREYSDFTIILHPAVTHDEESYDSYYGTSSSTVVDEPEWLELKAAGDRRIAVSVEPRSSAQIEALLAERSWLWKSLASPMERARVLERSAAVRGQLDLMVDRMMRSNILKLGQRIAAIYLIGSYAWSEQPEDLDLFVLVEGGGDVARFTGARLEAHGFELPGSEVPLDIEVVGWETLLDSVRGMDVRHAGALAQRYILLYGSVLLAGRDLHESVKVPSAELESLRTQILANGRRAEWPELAGDPEKVEAKRAWRLHEAEALSRFLSARDEPTQNRGPHR